MPDSPQVERCGTCGSDDPRICRDNHGYGDADRGQPQPHPWRPSCCRDSFHSQVDKGAEEREVDLARLDSLVGAFAERGSYTEQSWNRVKDSLSTYQQRIEAAEETRRADVQAELDRAEAAEQRISELEGALERILRLPDETANQIAADASRRKATMGRRVRTGGIGDPPLIEAERLTAVLQANARLVSRESEQRLVARQERDRAEAAEQERDETRAHWKREYEIEVERSEKVEAELTRVKGERDQLLQDLQDLGPNSLLRTRIEEVAQELEKQAGDARRRSEDAAGDAMWAGVASGISDAASLVRKAAKGEGE